MDLRRPRPDAREPLEPIGCARRFACRLDGAISGELWCFDAADAGVPRRLAQFGEDGVGGFSAWGEDDAGAFVVRRIASSTVASLSKGERLDGMSGLAKIRDLARALARCERSAVFPGPLRPSEIALGSAGRTDAFLLVEGWVRALVRHTSTSAAGSGSGSGAPSPRWMPPEQAAGAPWDNAANRYVLGLAAYRLFAGAHPLSGVGLREAIASSAGQPPPPFDDAIARTLKPGIQSLVLSMLDPRSRPESAQAIVERCEELLRDPVNVPVPVPEAVPEKAREPRSSFNASPIAASSRPSSHRRLLSAVPIAIGLAIAGAGFAASRTTDPPRAPPPRVLTQSPLQRTTSASCAPCHDRQVSEWQRSVMAHAVKSPLFGALESVVEEQVGKDDRCPTGAGVLRKASATVCRDERTGLSLTGTGGEHWCVNCHSAGDNLASTVPSWDIGITASQRPLHDVLAPQAMEGISCAVCHQTIGPVHATGYQGNPTWTSPVTGDVFRMRPEDGSGVRGIGNSGYLLDPAVFLTPALGRGGAGDPIVHRRPPDATERYLRSSEFCGACHDVRLFGTDSIGVRERGEHFKRLRNAYSEWRAWSEASIRSGRAAASCQDCHMSQYPGVCVAGPGGPRESEREGCPNGFHFEARSPGVRTKAMVASASAAPHDVSSHWFTSVDLPLSPEFPAGWANDDALDASGMPVGLEARRLQLLRHTFRFAIDKPARLGARLEIPIRVENTGAGHRVPAGFSQEREIWVEMTVKDGRGDTVYEVGKLASDDADLRDKVFLRIATSDDVRDRKGRPLGVFGADVTDGPDVPRWSPNPAFGGTSFRGQGLLNLQNGFLRCVRCIGNIDASGHCQPGPGQGRTRADRFDDGVYDIDTGECRSNLAGNNAFFETYFPVGALDADRGVAKAPDAILDQRSAAPGAVLRYTYELDAVGRRGPFTVKARLRFRPFPPYLLRAFADYEARKAKDGLRPSGAQVTVSMFGRNHPIDLAEASVEID